MKGQDQSSSAPSTLAGVSMDNTSKPNGKFHSLSGCSLQVIDELGLAMRQKDISNFYIVKQTQVEKKTKVAVKGSF